MEEIFLDSTYDGIVSIFGGRVLGSGCMYDACSGMYGVRSSERCILNASSKQRSW